MVRNHDPECKPLRLMRAGKQFRSLPLPAYRLPEPWTSISRTAGGGARGAAGKMNHR